MFNLKKDWDKIAMDNIHKLSSASKAVDRECHSMASVLTGIIRGERRNDEYSNRHIMELARSAEKNIRLQSRLVREIKHAQRRRRISVRKILRTRKI